MLRLAAVSYGPQHLLEQSSRPVRFFLLGQQIYGASERCKAVPRVVEYGQTGSRGVASIRLAHPGPVCPR
jgi:hypothetical protein